VADKLLSQLEAGTAVFQKLNPEKPGVAFQTPFNPQTNKSYRGSNALWLTMQDYSDPRWLTMRQANMLEAQVPKGTKGTPISFIKDVEGVATPQKAWVFNAEQLTNMPSLAESLQKLNEQKAAVAQQKAAPPAEAVAEVLIKGDEVGYKNTTYKIADVLKSGQVKIEDLSTGEKTKISTSDGLYTSLLQAKFHPELAQGKDIESGQQVTVVPRLDIPAEEMSPRSGVRR
jgi:hypothetical protein